MVRRLVAKASLALKIVNQSSIQGLLLYELLFEFFSGNKTCSYYFVLVTYDLLQYWSLIEQIFLKFLSSLLVTPPLILEKSTNLIMCTQRQINRLHNRRLCVLEFALSLCDNKIQLFAWYEMHELACRVCAHVCSFSTISVSLKIVQPIGNNLEKGLPYLVEILVSFSSYTVSVKGVNKPVWTTKRKCFC